MPVAITCSICGKVFTCRPSHAARRETCSVACQRERLSKPTHAGMRHLQDLAAKIGKTPGVYDLILAGEFDTQWYQRRFGSLSAAQAAAGLTPNRPGHPAATYSGHQS